MILKRLWCTVQDSTFERTNIKVPFLFIALTAGSLLMYPYVYKYIVYMYINNIGQLVVVNLTVHSADQNHVRFSMYFCSLFLNNELILRKRQFGLYVSRFK